MIRFKTFLTEATDASTYFEGVISYCINNYGNGKKAAEKKFKDSILKQPIVQSFLKKAKSNWAVHGIAKTPKQKKEQKEIFWNFAKLCDKKLPFKTSDAGAGQTKLRVSDWWGAKDHAAKSNDTSKTDITIGGHKVSVKGPKAQLMSGEKKESRATVLAAIEYSGGNELLGKTLEKEVNKFVTITRTIGDEMTGGELKKMDDDAVKSFKGFVKDLDKYKDPDAEDGTKKTAGQPDWESFTKKEKIAKLQQHNSAAKKIIDAQEKTKGRIQKKFKAAFENSDVATAFAYESMTGREKFGGKTFKGPAGDTDAQANYILVWDYNLTNLKYLKITPDYAARIGKKMKVAPDLKSGHYSRTINGKEHKLGYSFYQSLRLSVEMTFTKGDALTKDLQDQVEHHQNLLSEGLISLDKVKAWFTKAWNKFKEGIKKIWNWLAEKITEIKDAAIEMIQDGVESALNLFELDFDVKVNPVVTL